jgi:hypothetical protein
MSKRRTYNADELRKIVMRLEEHRDALINSLAGSVASVKKSTDQVQFDDACKLRDSAQHLVTTLLALRTAPTAISLAERSGGEWPPWNLRECGVEDDP